MRPISVFGLAIAMIACVHQASGQQPKIPRIGYLASAGSTPSKTFLQALRDLGYVEGQNIAIEYRSAEGKPDLVPDLAAELVGLRVDIIVADGSGPTRAAKKATGTIPIVMTSGSDPVGTGLVASLARPGGNVTGSTNVGGDLGEKLLEVLKEVVPKVTRVVILRPEGPSDDGFIKETEISARALGVQIQPLIVRGPDDFESAFRAMTKERANALFMRLPPTRFRVHYVRIVELTEKSRLPAISSFRRWTDTGGLMSYGPDPNVMYRRTATYVDKILKGTKPADLPVEAPTKLELVINLKAARRIGLTIPSKTLMWADKVIK